MRYGTSSFAVAFFVAAGIAAAPAAAPAQEGPVVAFRAEDAGKFPKEWKAKEDEGRAIYAVRADGSEAFLHAESRDDSHTIGYELSADPGKTPWFRFAWRPIELPPRGDERRKGTNDSALGVYVIFEGWGVPPKSLKYVWSTTLAPGTTTESPYSSRAKVVVLRSGAPAEAGRWVEEEVDVAADYRRLFRERDVPKVKGIALLTDSDNTGTRAAGEYRSFAFAASPAPATPRPGPQP